MMVGAIEFSWRLSSVSFHLHENNVLRRHYRTLMRRGGSPQWAAAGMGVDKTNLSMRFYRGPWSPPRSEPRVGGPSHTGSAEIKNDDLRELKTHSPLCHLALNDNVLLLSLKSFMSYSG